MSSEVARQAVASCEDWRHRMDLPLSFASGFLDSARNDSYEMPVFWSVRVKPLRDL
jgi:hypothetical protein